MVFEKSLKKPVYSWNITEDKFMFRKNPFSRSIYVVSMKEETRPQVFNFVLPEAALKDHISMNIEGSNAARQFIKTPEKSIHLASEDNLDEIEMSERNFDRDDDN